MTTTPFPHGSSVAAYLRDSGGDTQDLSVEQQENEIRSWCLANEVTLTRLFVDEAMPGSSTVGRSAFLNMIGHFSNNADEAGIVVWKFSRFAREIDDAQFYKADLRRRGYIIHSINENIPGGLDGRLFEAAIDWMNARFLQDLSEDVKRGLQHNLIQHKAIGGTPPRGFKRSDPIQLGTRRSGQPHIVHRWIPDPDLVPLVQMAFRMRRNGSSYGELTRETGLYKSKNSWNHFFRNEIYTGRMIYGGQLIENYCQPIIDRHTWEEVQKMNQNALTRSNYNPGNHPRAKSSDYILTGLLRCGLCGSPLTGETVHSKKKNHTNRYYACSLKKKSYGKECQARWIPKEYIELVVLDEVSNHILSIDNLTDLRDQAAGQSGSRTAELRAQLKKLQDERGMTHAQIDRLIDALADMGGSTSVTTRIKEKERQERELMAQISGTEQEIEALTDLPSDEKIQDLAEKIHPLLNGEDRKQVRRWLHELIDHIDVERGKEKLTGVIYYYTPGEFTSKEKSHRTGYIHTHKFYG